MMAQADTALPAGLMTGDIVDFTVDNLGNIYTISKTNQLKKTTARGDSVGVFNDVKRYGKLYSIDATNPLKILLFYKDFGTIVVLDRFLNARTTIDIRKQGIFQAKAIAQSYDNGIWIYDEQEAILKRMNDEGTIIGQTADLRQSMETAPAPELIVDQDRLVYLYDPLQGLLVFDYFGTLKHKIALLGWLDFQVIGASVFGRKGTLFERYELNSLSLQEQQFGSKLTGVDKIRIGPSMLYCLRNGSISYYKL
ncbi:MAG: hypothetical protein H7Y03_05105 [Chitinophagaceae bacterium]|nr:hypothetical protein [Chitinophagaceae bacterium]